MEALVADVGGVFGQSGKPLNQYPRRRGSKTDEILENHHPLNLYTREILIESLGLSPSFMRYYRNRLVVRVGEGDESVRELDRRNRKGWGEEWLPDF